MDDKFIGFKYNGLTLGFNNGSNFNGFIINEGLDLKFSNLPSFSNEFAFPKFGESSYYLGTTRENRTISFSVMLVDISLQKYRQFVSWISNNSSLNNDYILQFDYNDYFGYKVKLNSMSEGNFTVNPDCDTDSLTYNVEVELEFITFNDWAAQFIQPPTFNLTESLSGVSYADGLFSFTGTIISNTDPLHEHELIITNTGSISIFLKINFNTNISLISNFKVFNNGNLWYEIDRGSTYSIYTRYGLILDDNSNFYSSIKNKGVLEIPPGSTQINISSTTSYSGVGITIEPILREII